MKTLKAFYWTRQRGDGPEERPRVNHRLNAYAREITALGHARRYLTAVCSYSDKGITHRANVYQSGRRIWTESVVRG